MTNEYQWTDFKLLWCGGMWENKHEIHIALNISFIFGWRTNKEKKINERGTVTNDALIEVGKLLYLVVKLLLTNQMNGETNFKLLKLLTTMIMGGIWLSTIIIIIISRKQIEPCSKILNSSVKTILVFPSRFPTDIIFNLIEFQISMKGILNNWWWCWLLARWTCKNYYVDWFLYLIFGSVFLHNCLIIFNDLSILFR